MKNTTAALVFVKANSNPGKKNDKTKRIVITDVDLYEEEEMMKLTKSRKILNTSAEVTNKKHR